MVPSDLLPISSAGQPTHTKHLCPCKVHFMGSIHKITGTFLLQRGLASYGQRYRLWMPAQAGWYRQAWHQPHAENIPLFSPVIIACQGSKEPNCHCQLLPEQSQQERATQISHLVPAGCSCKGYNAHLTISPAQLWHPSGEIKYWTQLALQDLEQEEVYVKRENVLHF